MYLCNAILVYVARGSNTDVKRPPQIQLKYRSKVTQEIRLRLAAFEVKPELVSEEDTQAFIASCHVFTAQSTNEGLVQTQSFSRP